MNSTDTHTYSIIRNMYQCSTFRFTRDFNSANNTHLIADDCSGAKYEAALQCCRSSGGAIGTQQQQSFISIVKPSWVETCYKEQRLVDCEAHSAVRSSSSSTTTTATTSSIATGSVTTTTSRLGVSQSSSSSAVPLQQLSQSATCDGDSKATNNAYTNWLAALEKNIDELLSDTVTAQTHSWLFSTCQFTLVGFDNPFAAGTSVATVVDKTRKENWGNVDCNTTNKLCRLVRRCMATIYWVDNAANSNNNNKTSREASEPFHDKTTHMIVMDGYYKDPSARYARTHGTDDMCRYMYKRVRMTPLTLSTYSITHSRPVCVHFYWYCVHYYWHCLFYRAIAIHAAKFNNVAIVSVRWVIDSCRSGKIPPESSSPLYLPECRSVLTLDQSSVSIITSTKGTKSALPNTCSNKRRRSNLIFQGSLFVVLRIVSSQPGKNNDSASGKKIEKIVHQHGGHLLSEKLVAALRSDHLGAVNSAAAESKPPQLLRTCYVVCWSGGEKHSDDATDKGQIVTASESPSSLARLFQQQAEWHPLLSQIQRHKLCQVVSVTPDWVKTCIAKRECILPSRNPELFLAAPLAAK